MKIILRAFNKLESKPMDIPDNSGLIWRMALSQTPTFTGTDADIPMVPMRKLGTFEYEGKDIRIGGEDVMVYVLTDIS